MPVAPELIIPHLLPSLSDPLGPANGHAAFASRAMYLASAGVVTSVLILDSGTRNEEPFINATINGCGW